MLIHSATIRIYKKEAATQLEGGLARGGDHFCSFLKIGKKYLDFGKKVPLCVHPWVKFNFQTVVLRVSCRKKL